MNKIIRNIGGLTLLGVTLCTSDLVLGQTMTPTSTSSTTTTTSQGVVNTFSPDTIVVKTTTAADPDSYSYSKTTTYVDENGNAVSMETVKSGLPVTVYYTKDGDKRIATKVIVRKATTTTTTQ